MKIFLVRNYNVMYSLVSEVSTQLLNDRRDDTDKGLKLTHTTIMRWIRQYSPTIDKKIRKHLKPTNDSWRMDETDLKIKGTQQPRVITTDKCGN